MEWRRLRGAAAAPFLACLLLFAGCEREGDTRPFHSPLDLLPGSAHTIWIWDAPFPKQVPFFLAPPVPPRLLSAKEGGLALVQVQKRKGMEDAPIGGFDFGGKERNDQVLAELQGQVFRDLRFGTVSDLILLRGQLKADDVGGPGLSRQSWFVKTKLGLELLLPNQAKGSLRLILDPRRSGMLRPVFERVPRRFQSLLGFRSLLALGLGSAGGDGLVAYAPLVREPEGLFAELRQIPLNLQHEFQGLKASWVLLGLDLKTFLEEFQASLTTSNDPMQGGAMDFLSGRLLGALGPFVDPRIRASLGDFVAFATEEDLRARMPKDPSRFLVMLGLRDAGAFEAALGPFEEPGGRGARVFRLRKTGAGLWDLRILGFRFSLRIRKDFVLLSSRRTRSLASRLLEEAPGKGGEEGIGSGPGSPWRKTFLAGRLHLRGKGVYRLELGRVGSGLGASIIKAN